MGFFESFMGSSLANIIGLNEVGNALKNTQLSVNMDIPVMPREPKEQIDLPSEVQKGLYGRAIKSLDQGNYEVAIPLLIRAIKIDQNNYPECYGVLGVCFHISGKFDIALECYDRALHLYDRRKRAISDTNSNNILSSYLPQKDADQVNIMTIDKVREHKREIMERNPNWESPESWYESTYTWMYYPELIRRLSEKCEKRESINKSSSADKVKNEDEELKSPGRSKTRPDVKDKPVDKRYTLASDSVCPHCKVKLTKEPTLVTECPSCHILIYVRELHKHKYAVTKNQANEIDGEKLVKSGMTEKPKTIRKHKRQHYTRVSK